MKKVIVLILIFSSLFCNAQIFEDDFESGDFSNWTSTTIPSGATMTASATAKKNGSYGQYVDLYSASNGYHYALANYDFSASGSYEVWFRGWLYFDDLTTINTTLSYNRGRVFFVQDGDQATSQFSVNVYNSSGTYKMNAYIGNTKCYTDITISLDTWYEIKVRAVNSGRGYADTLQLWINTVSQGIKSTTAGITPDEAFDYFRCGFYPNQSIKTDATIYWDDVGIYTSDPGDFPTGPTGWTHDLIGVSNSSISEVNGVSKSNISEIIDQ